MPTLLIDEQRQERLDKLHQYIDTICISRANPRVQYHSDFPIGKYPTKLTGNPQGLSYIFYLRKLAYNYKMREFVIDLWVDTLYRLMNDARIPFPFQLGGVESSSIPFLVELQKRLRIDNIFTVRQERKDYGLFHFVNGVVSSEPVIFVDDLFNSGSTFRHFCWVCERELSIEVLPQLFTIMILKKNPPFFVYREEEYYRINNLFKQDDFDYGFVNE